MARTMLALLCCGVLLGATEPETKTAVEFRLKKEPDANQRGWMLGSGPEGFEFERFGSRRRSFVRWDALVDEDARRLRIELGLELTEEERLGLIDGHALHFKGGGAQTGVLEWVDEDGRHWLRNDGVVLPYPADRIDRVEEAKVKEDEVYSEDEVYIRRLERRPPRNAQEHVDLAVHMFDIGNWDAAAAHFEEAIAAEPDRAEAIRPRLAEIRDILQDEQAQQHFAKAKARANLRGDYAGAIAMIQEHIEANPGARRRGLRIVQEIEEKRFARLQAAFHRVKAREFERQLEKYLRRHAPDLDTAMSWVTGELPERIEGAVRTRLGLTEEEYEQFRDTKAGCAPHWASYWSGTFVVSSRARRGTSSGRQRRGDPDAWWHQYRDVETRSSFLRAYGAERLPELFEIITVRQTDCDRCGGSGKIRVTSLNPAAGGAHEWNEVCPRCFGAGQDRAVGYR